MHYPNIISDYFLVSDFVSQSVQLSSRAIFLNVLKGGIDFLLDSIEKDQLDKGDENSKFFNSLVRKQGYNSEL